MYQTLRYMKHKNHAVVPMQKHDLRERNDDAYSNKMIDVERSHLNVVIYNDGDFRTKIDKILAENNIQKNKIRKDAVYMCEILVGASEFFFDGCDKNKPLPAHKMQYFLDAFDFLKQKFGEKNVVSAVLHLDESNPHMHFSFVPLVFDQKIGANKLCAKDLRLDKNGLAALHTEFNRQVGAKYGLTRGIQGGQKDYVDKIDDFKRKKERQGAELQKEITAQEKIREILAQQRLELDEQFGDVEQKRREFEELRSELLKIADPAAVLKKAKETAQKKLGWFGRISKDDYAELLAALDLQAANHEKKYKDITAEFQQQIDNLEYQKRNLEWARERDKKIESRAEKMMKLCDELGLTEDTLENMALERQINAHKGR